MKAITKLFLVLTVANLTVGLLYQHGVLRVGRWPGLYVTLPVGAACFGLFVLNRLLEKESAAYDAEHQEDTNQENLKRPPAVHRHALRAELRALLHGHHQ